MSFSLSYIFFKKKEIIESKQDYVWEKNLVNDFFKKKLLIRDLKLFFKWNELLSMYRSLEEKKEGLEVFMERQLWPVVGTSDSCMCPDCSDLLSLATGLSNQACRLLAAAFQVFTRL